MSKRSQLKTSSPEQKAQFDASKSYGKRIKIPTLSKCAFAFWGWNRNRMAIVQMETKTRGAFGRIKPPRKLSGSLSFRAAFRRQPFSATKNVVIAKLKDSAGKIFGRLNDGSLIRLSPLRRWKGKSERRQVLLDRRDDRALALANLAAQPQ